MRSTIDGREGDSLMALTGNHARDGETPPTGEQAGSHTSNYQGEVAATSAVVTEYVWLTGTPWTDVYRAAPSVLKRAIERGVLEPPRVTAPPTGFCAGCGKDVLTIGYRLCGSCLSADADAGWCPGCGADLRMLFAREVVRRVRNASWDVAAAWKDGNYLKRFSAWQQVLTHRAKAGAR